MHAWVDHARPEGLQDSIAGSTPVASERRRSLQVTVTADLEATKNGTVNSEYFIGMTASF
jgi:hypothetical protein